MEYTAPDETAVCNLASISLSKLVRKLSNTEGIPNASLIFDFDKLKEVTMVITKNLNRVIDRNYYPIPEAKK